MPGTAFIPPFNRSNVLTGLASMYTMPLDGVNTPDLPDDTVALGTAWTAPWTPVGATQEGLAFEFSRNTQDITVEEQVTPVDVRTTDLAFNMNMVLSEDTLETMLLAYGGGTLTTTAAGASTPGTRTLQISSEVSYFAFGFEGKNAKAQWRRVLVPYCVSVGNASTTYRRADSQRMYEISLRSLVAPEDVIIKEWNAAPTS